MSDIDDYRKEIDDIDNQILALLARRQTQEIKIAHFKADKGLKAHQPSRQQAVIEDRQRRAVIHDLNPAVVSNIWQAIIAESIRLQEKILNKNH